MFNTIKNIYCWNANSISNKFNEIILALKENEIDILAINETKIDKINEFFYTNENYNCVFNSRNRNRGGVAFILRKEINFIIINDLEKFNCECLCIKIEINNQETYLITYYNSPTSLINIEIFEYF
jgi:exonuclease III